MDLRLDRSPWPPDDFQERAQRLFCKSVLETCYSQLGNESDGTYKGDQRGVQGAEGALSQLTICRVDHADASGSNIW